MAALIQRLCVLILIGSPLCAELLHVELAIGGLDCVSCAQSVDKVLKKIKGVESASFRMQDSVAVMDFKSGNTATLDQVRDAIKGIGYTPREARIKIRGQARQDGAQWMLQSRSTDFPLDVSAVSPMTGAVVVEGSIAEASAPLKVSSMRQE